MADLEVARQLFLEGSRFLERGDLESAELKLLESFHLFPNRHSTRQNLAVLYTARADQLVSHRKFENAFSLYDKAIEFSESYPVSWSNKGALLIDLGKDLEQAISCLKRAIDLMPDYADAHANLGIVYQKKCEHIKALEAFDQALSLNSDLYEAWINRGITLHLLQRSKEALTSLDQAIQLAPDSVEALVNRAMVLNDLNQPEEALQCLDFASTLNPDMLEIWLGRGISLNNLNMSQEALHSFDRANTLKPDIPEVLLNWGIALNNLNRPKDALQKLDRAIELSPNLPEAWNNHGHALSICKLHEESLKSYERAIEIKNDFAEAHYNKALLQLAQHNFKVGFENYIWRWRIKNCVSQPLVTTLPRCGPEFLGGRILLWAEQGLGDEIFYAGLLHNVIDNALRITVSADRRLHTIFKRSFPSLNIVDRKHVKNEDLDKKFDSQAPIGDLAYLLKLDKNDIKSSRRPFLLPDSSRVLDIKRNHPFVDNRLVCGISWRSNNRFFGEEKSIKLEQLRTLFENPTLSFVNLQYGEVGAEIQDFEERFGPKCHQINNLDLYNDIEGLTALIAACDFVVTTSSITAHLAGAIGKRGCVLVPFSKGKIWYWHLNDEFSFWYPSLKVFYQDHPSDWSNAILQASEWLSTGN